MGNICCKPVKPDNLSEKINKYYDEDTLEDSRLYLKEIETKPNYKFLKSNINNYELISKE